MAVTSEAPAAAPGAGQRARDDGFRPDIEGLRAIAVLAVVGYHFHVAGFSGGYAGVDVFFVISGFLITRHLLQRTAGGKGVGFADFYARRVRRILPLACLVTIATLLIASRGQNPLDFARMTASDSRSATLFFSNVRFAHHGTLYLAEADAPSQFQQYWSLSVEEQFYVVWPALLGLLVFLAARVRARTTTVVGGALAVVIGVSLTWSALAARDNPIDAFFLIQSRAWELAIGALVALVSLHLVRRARAGGALVGAGLAAIVAGVVTYGSSTVWPGLAALVPTLGTAAVILGGQLAPAGPATWVLGRAPAQFVGRHSYSVYLWHWPFAVYAAERGFPARIVAPGLAATVVLSILSYRFVEQPIRTSTRLRADARRSLALGAVLLAVTLAASYVADATVGRLDAGRPVAVVARRPGTPPVATGFVPSNLSPRLMDGTSATDPNAERNVTCDKLGQCATGSLDASVRVVLFGDSHAGHWAPALSTLASARGWRFDRVTRASCSSFLTLAASGRGDGKCRKWLRATRAAIIAAHPTMVVLSNRLLLGHRPSAADARGVREMIAAMPSTTNVVVLAETAEAKSSVPQCLARHLQAVRSCEPRWPRPALTTLNGWLQGVSVGAGAHFVDLTDLLCATNRCPAIVGNVLVYRDEHHVTTAFARSRANDIGARLAPLIHAP